MSNSNADKDQAVKFSMRFPTWVCSFGGAALVGGATWIAQAGNFESAGEAAGFLFIPILIGTGIGLLISKMQGVDPKYQKQTHKKDTP